MKIKTFVLSALLLTSLPFIVYAQSQTTEKKPLYWVDPMEPNIHYDAPGKSRMGMELVPVYPKVKKSGTESSAKE